MAGCTAVHTIFNPYVVTDRSCVFNFFINRYYAASEVLIATKEELEIAQKSIINVSMIYFFLFSKLQSLYLVFLIHVFLFIASRNKQKVPRCFWGHQDANPKVREQISCRLIDILLLFEIYFILFQLCILVYHHLFW
jgi:hypothetical protein